MPRSVCSTTSQISQVSVAFEGTEMSLERAIDKGIIQLQDFLNGLQAHLRNLASLGDLSEDPVTDFQEMIKYTDATDDTIDDMEILFDELKSVNKQILGPCPKACKEWYKGHVTERKVAAAAEREKRKAAKTSVAAFNEAVATADSEYKTH